MLIGMLEVRVVLKVFLEWRDRREYLSSKRGPHRKQAFAARLRRALCSHKTLIQVLSLASGVKSRVCSFSAALAYCI